MLDLAVIIAAVSGSQLIWLGSSIDTLHIPLSGMTDFTIGYWLVSALIAALWMASLAISLSRATDIVVWRPRLALEADRGAASDDPDETHAG